MIFLYPLTPWWFSMSTIGTIFSVGCELYLGDVTWLVKTSTNEAFTANPHHQRKDFLRNSESHVGHDGKRQIGNI